MVKEELQQFLRTLSFTSIEINTILSIIDSVSFTKGKRIPDTLEGKIVQDADRLDAIGAIGIARTFAYGGAKGQRLYDSNETNNSSLRHFSDKLLKLRDVMHTRSARGIAEQRHAFMENYLKQFLSEWNFSE
ncbi:hypothetical protein RWD45_06485 [Virgibacillus soli]|uniref:HD domain-containing protein n=1 Tax=Paracerasibacillus soli TaxID=480284 RepID=A0ABU5CPJ2_9BACI|nr:hypothetical protein [Virgibacillus soli]MDY0408274.1 hypothetical protein [Virgibacillus soli]